MYTYGCVSNDIYLYININIIGICLEHLKDGDELRPLPCVHNFHRGCIDEWLLGYKSDVKTYTKYCPCCRQDISPESVFSPFSIPSTPGSSPISSSYTSSAPVSISTPHISDPHHSPAQYSSPRSYSSASRDHTGVSIVPEANQVSFTFIFYKKSS